jgi:hypothetical protein
MKKFIKAAAIRAVRTFAQAFLSGITVGAAISEINWGYLASVAAVSAIYSILTSLATGLPEAGRIEGGGNGISK